MSRFDPLFADALQALSERGLLRQAVPVAPAAPGRVVRGGRTLLNLSGNDYLGLSRHPLLAARAAEWGRRHGTGSGASRLVTGTLDLHAAVEARIASFKGTEAALLFASGWQANATILPALFRLGPDPLVFTDRLNHASLHHGCQAAGVRQIRFRHNDLAHLDALLAARAGTAGLRFILTESVFSMDGDRCDLPALVALARRHDAFIVLDEAHATGVLGPDGRGLSAGIDGIDLVMGTFSKALGGFGAYVAGSRALCDYLLNVASGVIHTTSLPPHVLGAIDAALDLVPGMTAERAALQRHAGELRAALRHRGFATGASSTQIVPLMVGDAEAALALAARLEAAGILAVAIRPPTVPVGASRLRLALSAVHDATDVQQLLAALDAARP